MTLLETYVFFFYRNVDVIVSANKASNASCSVVLYGPTFDSTCVHVLLLLPHPLKNPDQEILFKRKVTNSTMIVLQVLQ